MSSDLSTTLVKMSSGISQQSPAVQRDVLKYSIYFILYLFGLFAYLDICYLGVHYLCVCA